MLLFYISTHDHRTLCWHIITPSHKCNDGWMDGWIHVTNSSYLISTDQLELQIHYPLQLYLTLQPSTKSTPSTKSSLLLTHGYVGMVNCKLQLWSGFFSDTHKENFRTTFGNLFENIHYTQGIGLLRHRVGGVSNREAKFVLIRTSIRTIQSTSEL